MRACQIEEFGGPEVLKVADVPKPEPGEGEVLIEVSRCGMNFADTHQRENSYLARYETPLILGGEVAGTTPDGRRVVALLATGGYAEYAVAHQSAVYEIPDGLDEGAALALIVQGLTAWHLYKTSSKLAPGESVVVISGAGGVGSLAVQLAKPFGAGRVIATASTPEKRQLALDIGADIAIDPAVDDLRDALRSAGGRAGVDVVLEMTGGRVFDQSLSALAPFGRLVTYGTASRQPPTPVVPAALVARSRAVIGFWLAHCTRHPAMLSQPFAELLELVRTGQLRPIVGQSYPLTAVRQAHEDLRARRTTGKVVLLPHAD
jgi:NADPH:quinone reductase